MKILMKQIIIFLVSKHPIIIRMIETEEAAIEYIDI